MKLAPNNATRHLIIVLAVGGFNLGQIEPARGETPLGERPEYVAGMEAMQLGLPEVAMRKLADLERKGGLTDAELSSLVPVLVEAQVRAGRSDLALEVIGRFPDLISPFWRGLALAGQGRIEDAELALSKIPEEHLYFGEARLTRASLLRALDRLDEAAQILHNLAESDNGDYAAKARIMLAQMELRRGNIGLVHKALAPMLGMGYPGRAEVDYLIAVAYLREKEFQKAHGALLRLQQSAGDALGGVLVSAVPLALADAEIGLGQIDAAVARLLELIVDQGDPIVLGITLQRMGAIGAFDQEEIAGKLEEWSVGQSRELAALATYHLAMHRLSEGEDDGALETIAQFAERFPEHYLLRKALTAAAKIHVRNGRKQEALDVLELLGGIAREPELVGGELDFLRGMARYSGGEFAAASADFERSALADSDYGLRLEAMYNAAVAAVKTGDAERFQVLFQALGPDAEAGESAAAAQADLLIGAGLEHASAWLKITPGSPDTDGRYTQAVEKLEEFVDSYPAHARMPEARLALVELYLLQYPRREKSAQRHLEAAAAIPEDSPWRERFDYVRMWAEEGGENPDALIAAALRFLEKWPTSEKIPDVRMKLGETYFWKQDFPSAQTQFELLASEFPDSPHAPAALFFAGRSAMALMNRKGLERAIEIWGQLVERGGDLGREASKQQAIAKRRLGQEREAIIVLDGILSSEPPPGGDFLYDILCEKGETLYAIGTEEDTEAAAEVFRQVIADPNAKRVWQNRARFHLAKCFERSGDQPAALEACFEVIASYEGEEFGVEEFVWFYRAGFEAVNLLREQERWVPAVNVAEKLAATNGPRSQEARKLANEIRLKHFLWEDE